MMLATMATWRSPVGLQRVARDEVHVWRAILGQNVLDQDVLDQNVLDQDVLDQGASTLHDMEQILSTEERDRAQKFYFEEDRRHYMMARGTLRVILSRYLDTEPSQLRFRTNRYGKPSLASPSGEEWLNFNVSHSGGIALYAVAHGRKVGIDLERIREDVSHELLTKRFFSPREYDVLQALPAEVKNRAFFDCWTRKEAYIKARGEGLTAPLRRFDVSLEPGEPARLLNSELHPDDVSRWSLQEITVAHGYAAAVAVEGHDWRMMCFDAAGVKSIWGNDRVPG